MKKIIFVLLLLLAGFTGEAYSQAVAKIGDTEYTTLAAACSAAHDGQTVKMLVDAEIVSTIKIEKKAITLDLNGHTILGNTSDTFKTVFEIASSDKVDVPIGDLTIIDSSEEKTGTISSYDNESYRLIIFVVRGNLTIDEGKITSPSVSTNGCCAVSIPQASGVLIINGGTLSTIKGCNAGSAPYAFIYNAGTTIINGGIIKNTSTAGGLSSRGVYNSGTLIVNGGEISAPNENAIWNLKNKSLSLSSAAKITGGIAGGNTTLDEYMITDNSDLNFIASLTTNKITYNRGSSNTFGTVCLPFVPDSKSTITYYTLKEATDNMLTLEQVDDFVANTPYIYFTEDGTYNVSKTSTTTLAANPVAGTASNDSGWSLKGVYKRTSVFASASDVDYDDADANHVVEPNSYYIKSNGFSKTDGYVVIKPFRAYITAPDGAVNSNHYEISVIDEATAMKSLLEEKQTISAIYDINGVRLSRLQRGVNIVVMGNGKRGKIIVK